VGRIFMDRERRLGLGWRLLCFLTLVMAATAGVAAVLAGSDPPVGRNLLAHLVAVALVIAITWLHRRQVDRRSWRTSACRCRAGRSWSQRALASRWGR
jgi:membrane protein YdbS with pleckstrin-like domain